MKVYLADIGTLGGEARFDALLRTLPACRREKVLRFRRDGARRQSLAAGLLLAYALSPFGLSEADAATSRCGKPYFPAGAGPFFNLSHSGDRVMCAVADRAVGCDTERIRDRGTLDRLARRCFAPEELAQYESVADDAERKLLFYRFWTLKESFLKAIGSGLSQPTARFCIRLADGGIAVRPADGQDASDLMPSVRADCDWTRFAFREFSFADGYCYALCLTDGGIPDALRPEWVDLSEIA